MYGVHNNVSATNVAMKNLHLAESVREMNALAATEEYNVELLPKALISGILWDTFEEANAAFVSGDEEEAYLKFLKAIYLYLTQKESAVNLDTIFHNTQLQQCIDNHRRLTESLIARYLALGREKTAAAANNAKPKSSGTFLGKLASFFSNESKSRSAAKDANYANVLLANGCLEIEKMRLRQQNIITRVSKLRNAENQKKIETLRRKQLQEEEQRLQKLRTATLETMRKREAEAAEQKTRLRRLDEEKQKDEQAPCVARFVPSVPAFLNVVESKENDGNRNLSKPFNSKEMPKNSTSPSAQHCMLNSLQPLTLGKVSTDHRAFPTQCFTSTSYQCESSGSKNGIDDVNECKLYFTGFPTNISEDEIKCLFAAVGTIANFTPYKTKAGEFRGMGTVEYEKSCDADRAIKSLAGFTFGGKPVKVSKYTPKQKDLANDDLVSTLEAQPVSEDTKSREGEKITIKITPKTATQTSGSKQERGRVYNGTERGSRVRSRNRDQSNRRRPESIPGTINEDNAIYFRGFPVGTNKDAVLAVFGKYGDIFNCDLWKNKDGNTSGNGVIKYANSETAGKAIQDTRGMNYCGNKIHVQKYLKKEDRKNDSGSILHVNYYFKDINNESELRHLFQRFGEIRYVTLDKDNNGKRTGFARICFRNVEHGNRAALEMDNYKFPSGKVLHVSKHDFRQNSNISQTKNETKACGQPHIFVRNTNGVFNNAEELRAAFAKFGPIKSARIIMENNVPRDYGFVCFYSHYSMNKAIEEMNNVVINGKQLVVRQAYDGGTAKGLKKQFLKQRMPKCVKKMSVAVSSILSTECSVCFTESSASESIVLSCSHVICKECIVHYIEVLVNNKEVATIICPKEDCDFELTFNLIKCLIPQKLLNEYDRCLMDDYLSKRDDIIWCPKPGCHCPVFVTPNMTSGVCPKCKFAFCPKCGERYHGFRECNDFANEIDKKLAVERYINGNADERAALEKRYTKKRMENALEEQLSNECIKEKCKRCPSCGVNIEKFDGCNKMACSKCKSFFCWLCMKTLDKIDPYKHFSESSSTCFRRLFPITN